MEIQRAGIRMLNLSKVILWGLIALFLASCVTGKKITYLQENTASHSGKYLLSSNAPYKLKPGDNLFIKVMGWEEKTYDFFNPASGNAITNFSEDYFYFNGYIIEEDGHIRMPVLGKIMLAGLTVEQAREQVQLGVDEYLKDGRVALKLANFNVSVLGEVSSPQKLSIHQESTTIYEVLAMCGDITPSGNRQNVKLIRQEADSAQSYFLDLTNASMLSNEMLYVQPGDLILVEPMKARVLSSNISQVSGTIGLIISVITLISILSL